MKAEKMLLEASVDNRSTLTLFSSSLLSKYGFGDGDQLYDWKERHIQPGKHLIGADLLVAAVEAHLLPALKQQVKIQRFHTVHNDIRAASVDGVTVDWDFEEEPPEWCEHPEALTIAPEYVTVTPEQLVALFPGTLSVEMNH